MAVTAVAWMYQCAEIEFQQPSTWIGVTSLAAPGYLVEVDAVAVLP